MFHRLIECETQVRRLMFEASALCEGIQQRMRAINLGNVRDAINENLKQMGVPLKDGKSCTSTSTT